LDVVWISRWVPWPTALQGEVYNLGMKDGAVAVLLSDNLRGRGRIASRRSTIFVSGKSKLSETIHQKPKLKCQ
jgi:hypothetical protein